MGEGSAVAVGRGVGVNATPGEGEAATPPQAVTAVIRSRLRSNSTLAISIFGHCHFTLGCLKGTYVKPRGLELAFA